MDSQFSNHKDFYSLEEGDSVVALRDLEYQFTHYDVPEGTGGLVQEVYDKLFFGPRVAVVVFSNGNTVECEEEDVRHSPPAE